MALVASRPYGARALTGDDNNHVSETPPKLIETTIFSAMPDNFRRKGVGDGMGRCQPAGAHPTHCFIEGPSFDKDGNLYIVDIPFGRIFRIAPDKLDAGGRI